jgi:hypothetical protein
MRTYILSQITHQGRTHKHTHTGPLVVSQIYAVSRSHHLGFLYLLFMTAMPTCILLNVDHEKV